MSEIRDLPEYLRAMAERIEAHNDGNLEPINKAMDAVDAFKRLREVLGENAYFTFEVKLINHQAEITCEFVVYHNRKSYSAPTVTGVVNAVLDACKKPDVQPLVVASEALNPIPF
jgi:hypothetical protein